MDIEMDYYQVTDIEAIFRVDILSYKKYYCRMFKIDSTYDSKEITPFKEGDLFPKGKGPCNEIKISLIDNDTHQYALYIKNMAKKVISNTESMLCFIINLKKTNLTMKIIRIENFSEFTLIIDNFVYRLIFYRNTYGSNFSFKIECGCMLGNF